jgi:hypothetical protein
MSHLYDHYNDSGKVSSVLGQVIIKPDPDGGTKVEVKPSTSGAISGAMAGAAAGSVVPVVGTMAGALIGFTVGLVFGRED